MDDDAHANSILVAKTDGTTRLGTPPGEGADQPNLDFQDAAVLPF